MFISSLEDKDSNEKDIECFKESEYKAKICSDILS